MHILSATQCCSKTREVTTTPHIASIGFTSLGKRTSLGYLVCMVARPEPSSDTLAKVRHTDAPPRGRGISVYLARKEQTDWSVYQNYVNT